MPLFARRSDGVLLSRLPGFRKMFPYLMPTRTESIIVHQQSMRMKKALAILERLNQGRTERRYTLFHILLAAGVRLMATRPENNRFVVGRRIYQRKQIEMAFVTKKELTESAAETNVKIVFEPTDTLEQVAQRIWDVVATVKKSKSSKDEDITETLTKLPRWLTRVLMWGWKVFDYFNLLPASAIKGDALYSSAYLANLGSIGIDAVQHHLFEWGTCSFFAVMGKLKKGVVVDEQGQPAVEDIITTSFTLDERIADGVNLAKTITTLATLIEDPEPLLTPLSPEQIPDPYKYA
ncbi:MAG: 2-oxo acid dehydrogenase subunit E2 [Deltaproteobacteria bacterium]|nr:2-oxo acid dehydrogenase subunit E2 [Deltaproteobacteria bacterium]